MVGLLSCVWDELSASRAGKSTLKCRSGLAREENRYGAGIQDARVIVDVFREQARSYRRKQVFDVNPLLDEGVELAGQ
jgi:hypothetical protein